MRKYFYVKLSGFLPVISEDESDVEWYVKMNVDTTGEWVGKQGERVIHGHLEAEDNMDAYIKVVELSRRTK